MVDPPSPPCEHTSTVDVEQASHHPTSKTSPGKHHGITRPSPERQRVPLTSAGIEKAGENARFLVEDADHGSYSPQTRNVASTGCTKRGGPSIYSLCRSWWPEASASVLILLVFVALVITLEEYQDQPQPNWPLGFSINTLVSMYTTLFKFPLMLIASECLGQSRWRWFWRRKQPLKDMALYESALRGDPFGVMQLLWTTRGRQLTATIGAVISLVSLVLDPFNQAVITIYPCQIPDASSMGGVPRVNTLQVPGTQPVRMQYNTLATILGVGSFDVTPSCQSGNCTFDQEYHSVGFCSKCTDISDQLLRNCTIPGNIKPQFSATLPSCRWFIQDDRLFENADNTNYIGFDTADLTNNFDLWQVVNYEATNSLNHTFSWIADPPQSLRCTVKPCVRSYKSVVVNGSFSERLVGESHVWPDKPDPPIYQWGIIYSRMLNRDCLPASAKQALTRQNIDITPEWIPYSYTVFNYSGEVLEGMTPDPTIPDQCLYQYRSYELADSADPQHNIITWFEAQFQQPLTAYVAFNGTNVTDGISSDFFDGALDSKAPPMFWYNGLDAMRAVYQNGSLTGDTLAQMFNNIATTLTNFVRSNPSALLSGNELGLDLTPAQAPELLQDSCIHINWPWLALPAALMVLSMLFLGLTVAQSALPNSIGIWKSSPLALLWHGFEVPQPTSATSDDRKTMEAMSSSMNVQLQQTGLGWKLVQ